ncbi:MAG: hypothetical protein DUD26_08935 [Eubacteriaceae bacterium]|uniref:Uncharacterized protein n=1 Tax=Candidatus Pseudoramibacter fermentans TaxID=2594427 RepID=A0A6L5GPU3_9FIRM|nr:hypothetical protein [Candidatus Pseudoramibacter fermentans]RRF91774.1 MAG: hypothetical protein DUD26_08935 [Eubacteriaceae bacterium]
MDLQGQLCQSEYLEKIINAIKMMLSDDEANKNQAKKELFGIVSENAFNMIINYLREQATKMDNPHYEKIFDDESFKPELATCAKSIGTVVKKYYHQEIDSDELIVALVKWSGMIPLVKRFVDAAAQGDDNLASTLQQVDAVKYKAAQAVNLLGQHGIKENTQIHGISINLSGVMISFYAAMAAYREVEKSAEEYAAAQDERIALERESHAFIQMLEAYRAEMNDWVNRYLSKHISVFRDSFAVMDRAILENDADRFIQGNADIQRILNYDVQFTNQLEFDDLMDSDEPFKL